MQDSALCAVRKETGALTDAIPTSHPAVHHRQLATQSWRAGRKEKARAGGPVPHFGQAGGPQVPARRMGDLMVKVKRIPAHAVRSGRGPGAMCQDASMRQGQAGTSLQIRRLTDPDSVCGCQRLRYRDAAARLIAPCSNFLPADEILFPQFEPAA